MFQLRLYNTQVMVFKGDLLKIIIVALNFSLRLLFFGMYLEYLRACTVINSNNI